MQHRPPAAWPALWFLACAGAMAAEPPAPAPEPPAESKWEGAIGPVVSLAPDYSGAATRKWSWTPGYYLRYGRLTISNTGGFVTRTRKDDIFRGLGLDLKRDDRLRLNVALRLDNGRQSSEIRGLEGVENVRRTIRARLSATWQVAPTWKLAAGLNTDLLGRGGGNVVDLGVTNDHRWSESTTWNIGAGLAAADGRYMRSWYGVSEAASVATGHPVYGAGAGLRDINVGTSWRTELGEKWIVLYGTSAGRLLGPAAASPLTTSVRQWGLSAALAWRF
jgi:outer membrane scaffolding protein for murein synthesis (MipA/OmpV family)